MNKTKISIILSDERRINLILDPKYAPISVDNFLRLCKEKFYDGTLFHRVIDNFMIQTGGFFLDGNSIYQKECPSIKGEFKNNGVINELKHVPGVISMARSQDNDSASSQFFVCSAECPWLDGSYAAFGYAADEESIEVVKAVAAMPTTRVANYFDDFPVDLISVKTIEILGEVE